MTLSRTPFRILAARAAVLAALGVTLAACNEKKAAEAPAPQRPVMAQAVHYELRAPARGFVGVIRPRIEIDQGFRVTGKVAARLVNVGDVVKGGQPLATLDSTDFGLQVEQAQAEVAAARGNLAQAVADERRQGTLSGQGWSSTATLDKTRAVAEEARGRMIRAERALTLAENALAYTTLRADGDGVVTLASVEPGQVVAAGAPAIRVARTGEKEALVAIPEQLTGRARSAEATVSLWSSPEVPFRAKLREFSPVADPATRTYQARFSIPDAPDAMAFGMTATVTLSDAATERVARLPLSALFSQGAGPAVWTVDPESGALTLRPVDVAGYEAREVLVRSGIEDGQFVVTLGVQKLDGGQKVRMVEATRRG